VAVLLALAFPAATAGTLASLLLYSAGLLAMLSFSALYNLTVTPRRKEILRRLDHSAIYLMIAGTYTPFALKIGGMQGIVLLSVLWGVAALGIALKLLRPRRGDGLSLVLYLAMGWSMLFALRPLIDAVTASVLVLLMAGGIVYTLGVVFHLWQRLRFNNAIWHLCVLAGAACHYAAVLNALVLHPAVG
jgi:hemolysin III